MWWLFGALMSVVCGRWSRLIGGIGCWSFVRFWYLVDVLGPFCSFVHWGIVARYDAGIVRQRGSSSVHVLVGRFRKKGIDDAGSL